MAPAGLARKVLQALLPNLMRPIWACGRRVRYYRRRFLKGLGRAMIRVGIGGWNFPEWRGTFYPKGLSQAKELEYASRALTSIEINGTFYRTPSAESFRKWAEEVPDGFVFSIKGPMSVVGKGVLAEAGP